MCVLERQWTDSEKDDPGGDKKMCHKLGKHLVKPLYVRTWKADHMLRKI